MYTCRTNPISPFDVHSLLTILRALDSLQWTETVMKVKKYLKTKEAIKNTIGRVCVIHLTSICVLVCNVLFLYYVHNNK